jgi:hypothetical protein
MLVRSISRYLEVEDAVLGKLAEHVVKKEYARRDLVLAAAIYIDLGLYRGFLGAAGDTCFACGHFNLSVNEFKPKVITYP